jgi:hypothetical protein
MTLFTHWMTFRDIRTLLRLLEAAEFFDPIEYNHVFDVELEKMLTRLPDSKPKRDAEVLRGFDWGTYISRSLRRAGFKDDDEQEAFHSIVIKLLVKPGKLFAGWEPGRHGPLERRFRRSVWNAIRNIAAKQRRRMPALDPAGVAERLPARQSYSDLIDEFRRLVAEKLGDLALEILDQRLRGEEMKELVRTGTGSAYLIKREVGEIKRLAERFAAQSGDPAFASMVSRALEAEAERTSRRKMTIAARQAAG